MLELIKKRKRIAVFMFMNASLPVERQEAYVRRYGTLKMMYQANRNLNG